MHRDVTRTLKAIALAGVVGLGAAVTHAQQLVGPARAANERLAAAISANPNLTQSPSTLLVQFKAGVADAGQAQALNAVGATVIYKYTIVPGLFAIEVGNGMTVPQAIAQLSASPAVAYAEPDFIVRHTGIPNDQYFGLQWGCHNTGQSVNGTVGTNDADIDAPEAWDSFTGSPSFVVAIIDSGTLWSHPDLAANIWTNPGEVAGNGVDDDGNGYVDDTRGWDFFSNDNNPTDTDGHGTHTAGTVGAVSNNGIGVAGVCWNVRLMPLRFLGPSGGSTSGAIAAVQYAVGKGVKISNNSWGGGGFSQSLFNAINNGKSVGHLFFAAAGNAGTNNDTSPFYPSNYNLDNVISVAATNSKDQKASFSNYGKTTVDIGAPGDVIASTYLSNGYAYLSGTSMACPHAAGVGALVYAKNPSWTYAQVRDQLFNTVRKIPALANNTVTGGVVNAQAAVAGAPGNTAPTVTISSPGNGSSFSLGANVTFTGSASDVQQGNMSASLVWTSSIQGVIGNGASFGTTALSAGTHIVTASVTDAGGLSGQAQVQVTITGGSLPAAPTNIAAVKNATGQAKVTWTDNAGNETGFEIQRQKRVGFTWTNTTSINAGANATQLIDSPGTGVYQYRVRAINGVGASAWTSWRQVAL
jgi:subtilisin family serine protease